MLAPERQWWLLNALLVVAITFSFVGGIVFIAIAENVAITTLGGVLLVICNVLLWTLLWRFCGHNPHC